MSGLAPVVAGGETRTISLYHIHTGESLTVTYMKDGRYVPSAMKQINYLLRDWRLNKTTTIDPRTIDLVWELHEDMGSHAPIHVVCGYRSAQTNAFLHRIGRHVARESQHIQGKAIDFYFTDVPTIKIRNTALVRQVGGVGYYRSAGGPTGFLHVDSGHVRHWGPYISPNQMAQIFREGQKMVGRRLHMNSGNSGDTAVASNDGKPGFFSKLLGLGKKKQPEADAPTQVAAAKTAAPPQAAYSGSGQADMADLSADAAAAPAKPVVKPPKGTAVSEDQMASLGDLAQDAAQAPKVKAPKPSMVVADAGDAGDEGDAADAPDATVKAGRVVPKPRLKPVAVMLMAAANMKANPKMIRITAARDTPNVNGKDAPSPVADSLGTLMQAAAEDETVAAKPVTKGKSSLSNDIRNGTAKGVPVIKPMIASVGGSDINWWPQLSLQRDATIRRDGKPPVIGAQDQDALPKAAKLQGSGDGVSAYAADLSQTQHAAEGKGDLSSNSDDKTDLDLQPLPMKLGAN